MYVVFSALPMLREGNILCMFLNKKQWRRPPQFLENKCFVRGVDVQSNHSVSTNAGIFVYYQTMRKGPDVIFHLNNFHKLIRNNYYYFVHVKFFGHIG
jgi:hypothetical protein